MVFDNNCTMIFRFGYQVSFVSNIFLIGVMYNTEIKWQIFYRFNKHWRNRTPWVRHSVCWIRISLSVVWQFTFILYSTQSVQSSGRKKLEMWQWRIIWKKACCLFSGSLFTVKVLPFDVNCQTEIYLIAVVFLVCTHVIKIGRVLFLPLIANILFVSINFSVERFLWHFFVQMNYQKKKLFNDF